MLRRRKSLMYVGTALALAGAGSASAATVGGGSSLAKATGSGPGSARAGHVIARHLPSRHGATRHTARRAAGARHANTWAGRAHALPRLLTWKQVRDEWNRQTNPAAARHGRLPLADRLMPVRISGPQAFMQIGPAQEANATTIVRRALHHRLGIRSAVIAVATAMQESMLHNISYGDADSIGLFQQQPDCGWGTAAQIMNPAYASDAFLAALRRYQHDNPSWAQQPLWHTAQAVQRSGFPFAYAKWEAQAAQLVQRIAMRLA